MHLATQFVISLHISQRRVMNENHTRIFPYALLSYTIHNKHNTLVLFRVYILLLFFIKIFFFFLTHQSS